MGRRILILSDRFLTIMFARGEHHYQVIAGAFPPDARIVGAQMEFISKRCYRLHLLVESREWEDTMEGVAYPVFEVIMNEMLYPAEVIRG